MNLCQLYHNVTIIYQFGSGSVNILMFSTYSDVYYVCVYHQISVLATRNCVNGLKAKYNRGWWESHLYSRQFKTFTWWWHWTPTPKSLQFILWGTWMYIQHFKQFMQLVWRQLTLNQEQTRVRVTPKSGGFILEERWISAPTFVLIYQAGVEYISKSTYDVSASTKWLGFFPEDFKYLHKISWQSIQWNWWNKAKYANLTALLRGKVCGSPKSFAIHPTV